MDSNIHADDRVPIGSSPVTPAASEPAPDSFAKSCRPVFSGTCTFDATVMSFPPITFFVLSITHLYI
jgi:hypothetical protein